MNGKKNMKTYILLFVILLTGFLPHRSKGQNSMLVIEADSTIDCKVFEPILNITDLLNHPAGKNFANFDFTNDNVADLEFSVDAYIAPMSISNGTANAYSFHNNLEFACDTYYYAWPDTFAIGDTLQQASKEIAWTSRLQWPDYPFNLRYVITGNGGNGGTGLWQDTGFHYLAFRFIAPTDTLYGYFKMSVDVSAGSSRISVASLCFQGNFKYLSGVEDLQESTTDFILSPNPAYTSFLISFAQKGNYTARIQNVFGDMLKVFQFSNTYTADISDLPDGIYYVTLERAGKKLSAAKLIKQ